MVDRERLRAIFDEDAELYDRARPTYPPALLDDLVELAGLDAGARIVEIGPGTGKATVALAERGLDITAVELGPGLARVARRNLTRFPHVRVVVGDFDTWVPDGGGFDAVVAFTAFHWLDPRVRLERSAAALRPGGALAVVAVEHVLEDDGDPFFRAVGPAYERAGERDTVPSPAADVPDLRDELAAGGLFLEPVVRRHVWDLEYDADAYLAVLDTYSGHRAMAHDVRERLYGEIRELIGGGRIRKTYLALLHVARRR